MLGLRILIAIALAVFLTYRTIVFMQYIGIPFTLLAYGWVGFLLYILVLRRDRG